MTISRYLCSCFGKKKSKSSNGHNRDIVRIYKGEGAGPRVPSRFTDIPIGAAAQENVSEEAGTPMGNANGFLLAGTSASPASSAQLVGDFREFAGSDEAGDQLSPISAASNPDEDEDYANKFMHEYLARQVAVAQRDSEGRYSDEYGSGPLPAEDASSTPPSPSQELVPNLPPTGSISDEATTTSLPAPLTRFTVFKRLPTELRMMIWHGSRENRVLSITRQRRIHVLSLTAVDELRVNVSTPVGTLTANHESRGVALEHYPLAFGTNTAHLAAGAQLGRTSFPPQTPFSSAHDIVYIEDLANAGLQNMAPWMNDEDRRAIQRLAVPINSSQAIEIVSFVALLPSFSNLQELTLVVDEDQPGVRRHSRRGFQTITAAWSTAIQRHYDSNPTVSRPILRFEIPGWLTEVYEGTPPENRSRLDLGVSALNRRASIRGQEGMPARAAPWAVRQRAWSL